MAYAIAKFYLVMMFLLLLVLTEQPSSAAGCLTGKIRCLSPGTSSLDVIQSRKILVVSKESRSNVNGEKKLVVEELRAVPSGPDPLHHNGRGDPNHS